MFLEISIIDPNGFDLFLVLLWNVWHERNKVFQGDKARDISEIIASARQFLSDFKYANGRLEQELGGTPESYIQRWMPPQNDKVLKFNCDASWISSTEHAAISFVHGLLNVVHGLLLEGNVIG